MSESLRTEMEHLMRQEKLPASFLALAMQYYRPLADAVASAQRRAGRAWMLGVNGAQGTGKSTLASVMALFLEQLHGLRCVSLSIDDLYYTRAQRQQLAREQHPLLKTRGVPGTHDLELGMDVCRRLLSADEHSTTLIPRFNKALDDRYPAEQWTEHCGRIDVLIFEGWCVGNQPQPPEALDEAVNELEYSEDADGSWRRYVNDCLQAYQPWFAMIDQLVMLRAPSMAAIFRWRLEQERKLAATHQGDASRIMNEQQINRFIQHYERLTTYALAEMPQRADCVFHLNEAHDIVAVSGKLGEMIKAASECGNAVC